MNRIKILVLFLAVSAIFQATPSLIAQQQVFNAKVPFQFSTGDRTLPAGEYRITRHNAFLNIENRGDYGSSFIIVSDTISSDAGEVHLVFDHVNEVFFLRRIVASVGSIDLPVSRTEKEAKKEQRRLSAADPPVVTVPAATTGGE